MINPTTTPDAADRNTQGEQPLPTLPSRDAEAADPSVIAVTVAMRRLRMSLFATRMRAMIDISRHCRAMAEIEEVLRSVRS